MLSRIIVPLFYYLYSLAGEKAKASFLDSMQLTVCHNKRIQTHKVFKGLAQRSKTSMEWFYSFKPHFLDNEKGQILQMMLTSGSVDDRAIVGQCLKE